MPAAPYIAMDMVAGAGEIGATHPAVTILIGCGLAVFFYALMRFIKAQERRERERT